MLVSTEEIENLNMTSENGKGTVIIENSMEAPEKLPYDRAIPFLSM
jgi:hypothetical protein